MLPRRRFLAASATALSMSALGGVHAPMPATAGCRSTLVLYRDNHAVSREFAQLGQTADLPVQALASDPVRQWRDGLVALVSMHNWRLAGISNWIDFTIMRGLAAESRRLPLLVLPHNAAQLQQRGIAALAAAMLDLAQETNTDEIVRKQVLFTGSFTNINNRPDLFAWVI